jgi:hypothetical protein
MELQSPYYNRWCEWTAIACQPRPQVKGYDENRNRRKTMAGPRNAHAFARDDGAAEVTRPTAAGRAASWDMRDVGEFSSRAHTRAIGRIGEPVAPRNFRGIPTNANE